MDFQQLGNTAAQSDNMTRPITKGRVLQADADFFCYYCAKPDEHVNSNFRNLLDLIEMKRVLAGAEVVNVHVTLGLKGGRNEIATVKEYQGKRDDHRDPALKARVHELRSMLANHKTDITKPVVNLFQEADDSLCQHQVKRIATHGEESTIIMSGDKDLWMVDGLHCDGDTGRTWRVKGYGKTEYREVGNVKPKLVGEGTSWFWHQMIMGDTADNIPGLPTLSGRLANRYLPTKTLNRSRPAVACGEAKAVAMLLNVRTDQEAFLRVHEAYIDHYGHLANEMFYEQAFLLWMRRTGDVHDVKKFLEPLGFKYTLSKAQQEAMAKFKERVLLQIKVSKEGL
jgi:DNA polymerase-1